jgi:hypothetical protein
MNENMIYQSTLGLLISYSNSLQPLMLLLGCCDEIKPGRQSFKYLSLALLYVGIRLLLSDR